MRKKFSENAVISVVLLLCLMPFTVLSNPLEDILSSPEFRKMPSHSDRDPTREIAEFVDPESNYGVLVLETGAGSILSEWMSPAPPGFKVLKESIRRLHEYIEFTQVYTNKQGHEFYFKAFVPYPKFIDAAELGVLKQFNELSPPSLKIDSTEKVKVRDYPADLYHRTDGTASLLLKFPKNTLINFLCLKPEAVTDMISLASMLNLPELFSRLAS